MTSANSWQSANLGSPIALTAETTYWMTWGPQN